MVVRRLVLLQLTLVPVAARADGAHEGLLAGVDANVRHVAFAPQEAFVADLASVGIEKKKILVKQSKHKRTTNSSIVLQH